MPKHFHGILAVTRSMARPLGNAIGGFKTGCEKLYRELALSAQDKVCAPDERLWADGFQDSILLHDRQLDNMFTYLRDNPRRLAIKLLFPNLFRVVVNLRVDLRLAPQAQNRVAAMSTVAAIGTAPTPAVPAVAAIGAAPPAVPFMSGQASTGAGILPQNMCSVPCSVPTAQAVGYFSALGNRFLLGRQLLQVQVSRRDFRYRRIPVSGGGLKIARDGNGNPQIELSTGGFNDKCESLLAEARRGAVLISPCVSDGEREIARRALVARLPLVALVNKGFSPLTKPSGVYFDACADGRLLMLAPINWPYVPGEKPMTREDALVLNRLAQALAAEGAAEVNYHGIAFEHVDTLALQAVGGA